MGAGFSPVTCSGRMKEKILVKSSLWTLNWEGGVYLLPRVLTDFIATKEVYLHSSLSM